MSQTEWGNKIVLDTSLGKAFNKIDQLNSEANIVDALVKKWIVSSSNAREVAKQTKSKVLINFVDDKLKS